jgi:DNA-binding HxlR family transcriptional regulator
MATCYGQNCPVARALDMIGERWTLLILRDLKRFGPMRFQQFEEALPGIAPNTLSARLKALEAAGVIATRLYESHPPRYEYFLTEKGKALGPVFKSLYAWGTRAVFRPGPRSCGQPLRASVETSGRSLRSSPG